MARENYVFFTGQVESAPRVHLKNKTPVKGVVAIRVVRRFYINDNHTGTIHFDIPILLSSNIEIISQIGLLQKGDIIAVKGAYNTRDIVKDKTCECGHVNRVISSFSFITPIFIEILEKGLTQEQGFAELKKRSEISNQVIITGNLCKDPKLVTTANRTTIATYQLASNRKYNLNDGYTEEYTDYPFIRSFHRQAVEDAKHLRKGSTVLVNGAVQTRNLTRNAVCESCKQQYSWTECITEIVPYSVEYLRHCCFDKIDEEDTERFSE